MTVTDADLNPDRERPGLLPRHVKGLLRREWLQHRGLFVGSFVAYAVCGWVLLIFFDPGWIIAFGVLFAGFLARALGGADAGEGAEEFAFSLPPTRAERYLVRMTLGLAAVFALTLVGTLSIAYDLPQLLWRIFVETGFTEPFPHASPLFLYPLAVALSFATFAFSFLLAAEARTRGGVDGAWFLGVLLAGAVFLGGVLIERYAWHAVNGWVSIPLLLALGAAALVIGYLFYRFKEGVARPTPVEARGGTGWVWIIVGIIVAMFLLFAAA